MKSLVMSKFKMVSIGVGITAILGVVLLFNWQGGRLDTARNQVSELRSVIQVQQQTVSAYKREIELQKEINTRVTTQLAESNKQKVEMRHDISELRRSDDEVDEYLSSTIPDALYDRLR